MAAKDRKRMLILILDIRNSYRAAVVTSTPQRENSRCADFINNTNWSPIGNVTAATLPPCPIEEERADIEMEIEPFPIIDEYEEPDQIPVNDLIQLTDLMTPSQPQPPPPPVKPAPRGSRKTKRLAVDVEIKISKDDMSAGIKNTYIGCEPMNIYIPGHTKKEYYEMALMNLQSMSLFSAHQLGQSFRKQMAKESSVRSLFNQSNCFDRSFGGIRATSMKTRADANADDTIISAILGLEWSDEVTSVNEDDICSTLSPINPQAENTLKKRSKERKRLATGVSVAEEFAPEFEFFNDINGNIDCRIQESPNDDHR